MKQGIYLGSYLFFLNLAIVSFVLLLLNNFTSLNTDLLLSSKWFFSIGVSSLLFSLLLKYNLNSLKHKKSPIIESIFSSSQYYFISLLIIIVANQFLKLDFLTERLFYFTIFTIVFGFLTFYKNKDRVKKEIEDEKVAEEKAEKNRVEEFESKFPIIAKIWGLRTIVKWMYKEGWGYSIGLIVIVVLGFILRIWLAQYQIVAIDEVETTDLVSKGFIEYHKISTSISGVSSDRSPLFNLLSAIPYYFIQDPLLRMRFFSLFFFSISLFFIYFIIKDLYKNKKVSLLSTFFISINWYLVSSTISARSYSFFIFFSLVGLWALIKFYQAHKMKESTIYLIIALFTLIVNFFEGNLVLSFHIIPLLGVLLIFKVISLKKNIYFLIISFLSLISFSYLLFFYDKTILRYLLEKLSIKFSGIYLTGYEFYGSLISYFLVLGIIIIFLSITLSLISSNKGHFLIGLFILLPFLQIILFSDKSSYPRYLSYISLPIIMSFSFFLCNLFREKIPFKKLLTIFFILLFLGTSAHNLLQLRNQEIQWQTVSYRNWEKMIEEIPENSIVFSDYPALVNFYRDDLVVYYLRHNLDDYATLNNKGLFIDQKVYQNKNEDYNVLFLNSLKQLSEDYVIQDDQQYHYTSSVPKVMDLNHLDKIVDNKKSDQEIFLLLSHNVRESKYHVGAPELYSYLFENMETIKTNQISNSKYSTQIIYQRPKITLELAHLKNELNSFLPQIE
jgi:hypothetical protein